MISIKKYLSPQERDGTRLQVIATFLEGMSRYWPVGDPAEHERFKGVFARALAELTPETESPELLLMAEKIIKALQEHNRRTESLMSQQSVELRNIVEMLTHTVGAISAAKGRSVAHLAAMQAELTKSSGIDDVRILKRKISGCLKEIEAEVHMQNEESSVTLDSLRSQLQYSNKEPPEAGLPTLDRLTELPGRADAEKALVDACRAPAQTYAIIYVMERIALINSRFGVSIGDQALREFKAYIMQDAHAGDRFFRWSGPTFLALVQRAEPIERVRFALANTLSEKCELSIETETRNLMLPLSGKWAVFPMLSAPRLLIAKLEAFHVAQTRA